MESLHTLSLYLPQDLYSEFDDRGTDCWRKTHRLVESSLHILQKLRKAYSVIEDEECDSLPNTNNPVESINRQSVPDGAKLISLKPLVEHIYLEDKCQVILQLAMESNVTILYQVTPRQEKFKPSEKHSSLHIKKVPTGSRAIGT